MNPMVQPTEFLHTAFLTRDIGRSIRAWQDLVGASVELPPTHIAADDVNVCILSVANGRIELVQPGDAARAGHLVREAKSHPDHVCLACDNLDERIAGARERGGIVVRPPVRSEAFGKRMCFILYPDIGLVEWVGK